MAMPAVVELPRVLNATGVLDDIVALPPPQNSQWGLASRRDVTLCVRCLNETIVLTSTNS